MTSHRFTLYKHRVCLLLWYPLMLNVTLEYTITHFNVLGETLPGNPSPTFHTHQLYDAAMVQSVKSSVECVP